MKELDIDKIVLNCQRAIEPLQYAFANVKELSKSEEGVKMLRRMIANGIAMSQLTITEIKAADNQFS